MAAITSASSSTPSRSTRRAHPTVDSKRPVNSRPATPPEGAEVVQAPAGGHERGGDGHTEVLVPQRRDAAPGCTASLTLPMWSAGVPRSRRGRSPCRPGRRTRRARSAAPSIGSSGPISSRMTSPIRKNVCRAANPYCSASTFLVARARSRPLRAQRSCGRRPATRSRGGRSTRRRCRAGAGASGWCSRSLVGRPSIDVVAVGMSRRDHETTRLPASGPASRIRRSRRGKFRRLRR